MMTKLSPRAHAIMEAYETTYTESGLVAAPRELVNQLKYMGITEKNILEIADELEAHYD